MNIRNCFKKRFVVWEEVIQQSSKQCDQIGRLLKVLGNKFPFIVAQKDG